MNYRMSLSLLLIWVFLASAVSCTGNREKRPPEPENKRVVEKSGERDIPKGFIDLNTPGGTPPRTSQSVPQRAEAPFTPAASGPVTWVPWENDSGFMKMYAQAGASVRIAAYCTVLKDPLPGEEYNVHLAASLLKGAIVAPGQVFSQNSRVGPYTPERGFRDGPVYLGTKLSIVTGGGVCKIASTLYNVAVLSNLQIVERHEHGMPVPYVPYGQDATVSYGINDFKFRNDTGYPLLIWAQGIDNALYIAYYGRKSAPKVEWQHEITSKIKAPVIFVKNPKLVPGSKKVRVEGMDGAFVRSWVLITKPDGTIYKKRLRDSSYSPLPFVIETNK